MARIAWSRGSVHPGGRFLRVFPRSAFASVRGQNRKGSILFSIAKHRHKIAENNAVPASQIGSAFRPFPLPDIILEEACLNNARTAVLPRKKQAKKVDFEVLVAAVSHARVCRFARRGIGFPTNSDSRR